jgi:MFS family permease
VRRLRSLTSDTFRSLNSRNFRLFFAGQLISQVGNWSTMIVQTLLVLRLTDDGFALGLLAAAQFGPVLLFGPFAGLIADRSDKRRLIMIVQSLAMAQSFALAAIGFQESPPLLAIYLVAVVGGFTTAFDNPARRAFVVEMVPAEDIPNAVSLNSALMTGSRVLGPALGGLMVATVGFGWAFAIDGLSYLAVLAGLSRMDTAALRPAPPAVRGKGQVREGVRYARSVPELWVSLTMMAVIGTLAFNYQTTLPLFALRDLGGGEQAFPMLMAVLSLGSVVGALATARRRTIGLRTVSTSALAFGVAMAVLTVSPSLAVAFPVGFLLGLASISFMTAATALVQLRAAPAMRGRVLALQTMVFLGSTPIGGPIVGYIAEHAGARWSLALGAVGTLVAGAAGWTRGSGSDAEPVGPAAGPGAEPPREPAGSRPARAPEAAFTVLASSRRSGPEGRSVPPGRTGSHRPRRPLPTHGVTQSGAPEPRLTSGRDGVPVLLHRSGRLPRRPVSPPP